MKLLSLVIIPYTGFYGLGFASIYVNILSLPNSRKNVAVLDSITQTKNWLNIVNISSFSLRIIPSSQDLSNISKNEGRSKK